MKPSQRRSLRIARLAVFLSAVIFLLAAIAHLAVERRATQQQIARLQSVEDHLRPLAERLDKQRRQAAEDAHLVLSLLAACRTAADIPTLSRERVVAREQGYEALVMSIPEGSHVLEISAQWEPAPNTSIATTAATDRDAATEKGAATAEGATANDPAADSAAVDRDAATGKKRWDIPLQASSGYHFQLISDRDGQSVRWVLTGNHPAFETRQETIPLDGFVQRGASWSGSGIILYPNQVRDASTAELEQAAISPPGVHLMQTTLTGPQQQQSYEMTIALRLVSEGPACVTASDARRLIILGRDDLLMPYRGGGKYELRPPAATTTAASGL